MFRNPSYTQTSSSSLIPAIQYSSRGPGDNYHTPAGHTPKGRALSPPGEEERIYHELEAEGERKEGDYEEIEQEGGAYHVGEGQEGRGAGGGRGRDGV